MKTAISIPDNLFQRVESMARRCRISRSKLIALAVERYLDDYDDTQARAALDEVYSSESSTLPSGASAAQAAIASVWED